MRAEMESHWEDVSADIFGRMTYNSFACRHEINHSNAPAKSEYGNARQELTLEHFLHSAVVALHHHFIFSVHWPVFR